MAGQAQVRSIDDIARFRAALCTFLSGARAAVEECSVEAGRQQAWLEQDRRRFWEAELVRRQRRWDEAKEAAFTDALASGRGPGGWHQMQVRRPQQAVEEATVRLERVRRWARAYQNTSLPLLKQVERLQTVLSVDMARAVHELEAVLRSLEAYAGRGRVAAASGAGVGAGEDAGAAGAPALASGPAPVVGGEGPGGTAA